MQACADHLGSELPCATAAVVTAAQSAWPSLVSDVVESLDLLRSPLAQARWIGGVPFHSEVFVHLLALLHCTRVTSGVAVASATQKQSLVDAIRATMAHGVVLPPLLQSALLSLLASVQ